MTMDAVTIETLPTTKSLLSTNVPDSTDIAKEKDDDILFLDEIDEDDEIRLRLSDDEEIEQENTLEHTENQHANLQLKKNDIEFDVHIAVTSKETSKSHSELKISQDLPEKISTNFIKNQSIKNSQSKKLTNEIENINDEESTMSGNDRVPPLTQNSRKFWSNNFDKRWKGINSPRGRPNFSHRNSNDWYNQQYSDQDKFNNRNNFNHHNNHFNKLRHNIRGGYSNKSVDFRNKEIRKEEADESVKLKHNILSSENVNDKSNSIQENGISNSIQTRKNDSSVKNDKSVIANVIKNDKEMKVIGKELNHKNSAQITSEVNLNVETCKENGNIGDILKDNDVKSVEKSMNKKLNDNGNLSTTKDCNVLMIESEKENCDSESEEVMKEESKCNTEIGEIEIGSDTSFILNGVELEFETNSIEKNSGLSSELKMFKVNGVADQLENLMEVDMNNQDLCNNIFKNGNSDQISECVNAKDIVLELSENYNKNLSETCEIELEADNISTFNDEQTSEAVEMSENANDSLDDKLISQMEISESEQNDSASSQTTNINENVETESSSDLISTIGAKDSDSNCFVRNENNSSKSSSSDNINNGDVKNNVTFKKETKHVKSEENNVKTAEGEKSKSNETEEEEKISSVIEEVDLVDDEAETGATTHTPNEVETDAPKTTDDVANGTTTGNKDTSQIVPINTADGSKVEESNEDGRAVVHKRRRRKRLSNIAYLEIASNEVQTENGVRQKRRSARNAEEMIRKEILKNDEEDEDSSDESGKLIPVNYKKNNYTQSLSPPSLKRTLDETDRISDSVTLKRIKSSGDNPSTTSQSNESKEYIPKSKESITEINGFVRQISQEDIRGKLKKLKQEELEALLLQKIVECITIRGEMGKLREEARVSKRNQEATRTKCQQLQKQVEGFDMVLKRISYDKSSNNDKYAPPIKINRSVGLQVNFLSDHGIHNLKQIQAMKASGGNPSTGVAAKTTLTTTSASAGMVSTAQDNRSLTQSPRKMLKVRSPRRPETSSPTVTPGSPGGSSAISTSNGNNVSATNLVMSKPNDQNAKRAIALQNSNNLVQLMPTGPQQQAVAANPNISGATTRQANLAVQRPNSAVTNKTSDLIDLTDEEDKSKNSVVSPVTTGITTRFPRVLQAVPASVALNNQTNIRLLQGGNQGSQTAIVNNINTPRLAYVMQGGMTVPTRQLVLANNNAIRPVTSVSTRSIPTISYKQGLQTLTNGTVRVLTTQTSTTNLQHPAPLPESSIPESNPSWKSPPPAPSLKISKVPTGIVLSWNMSLSDKFAEIVSYQLYAYQEVAGTSPSASLWKKVGDVRALPLPMACTLTQFTEGNNYYFAVRAVDIHSRFGQYSKPGNISL